MLIRPYQPNPITRREKRRRFNLSRENVVIFSSSWQQLSRENVFFSDKQRAGNCDLKKLFQIVLHTSTACRMEMVKIFRHKRQKLNARQRSGSYRRQKIFNQLISIEKDFLARMAAFFLLLV